MPLFAKHDIQIDFTKRGFVKDRQPKPLSKKIKDKWKRLPVIIKYNLELITLK